MKNTPRHNFACLLFSATFLYGVFFVPHFFQTGNLYNIVLSTAVYGIVALGMMLILLGGAIDLSLGMQVAVASIVACRATACWGFELGILFTIIIGALIGWLNGAAVVLIHAAPVVTTLGSLTVLHGLGYILADAGENNGAIPVLRQLYHTSFGGFIPVPLLIFFLAFAGISILLKKTEWGANLYAIGGSVDACHMAGVPAGRVCRTAFLLAGICAATGGVLFASQMNTGSVILGENLNLIVLSSCVLGGISVVGGRGAPIGLVCGVAAIQVIQNIMSLYAIAASTQLLITGMILLITLVTDKRLQKRKEIVK